MLPAQPDPQPQLQREEEIKGAPCSGCWFSLLLRFYGLVMALNAGAGCGLAGSLYRGELQAHTKVFFFFFWGGEKKTQLLRFGNMGSVSSPQKSIQDPARSMAYIYTHVF